MFQKWRVVVELVSAEADPDFLKGVGVGGLHSGNCNFRLAAVGQKPKKKEK